MRVRSINTILKQRLLIYMLQKITVKTYSILP